MVAQSHLDNTGGSYSSEIHLRPRQEKWHRSGKEKGGREEKKGTEAEKKKVSEMSNNMQSEKGHVQKDVSQNRSRLGRKSFEAVL